MAQDGGYTDEIDLRQYIEALWRGRWVVLAVTLCAMLAAGLISSLLLDPVYESTTVLTVNLPTEVGAELGDPVITGIIGSTPQAHVRLLRDPIVLDRAARSLGSTSLDAAALAKKVTTKVAGDASKSDRLVEIAVKDPVPENARALAEAIVEAYRGYLSDLVSARLSSRKQALSAELAHQEAAVSEKLERLKEVVGSSGGTDLLTQEINSKAAELASYRWEFAQLTSEERAASDSLRVLEEQLSAIPRTVALERPSGGQTNGASGPETWSLAPVQLNPAYTSLLEDVARKRASLAETRARLAAARKAIPVLEAEIAELKTRLMEEEALEERLADEVSVSKGRVVDLATKLQNLEGRDASALVSSAIGIAAPATLPVEPSGPRKVLNVAIAGVLGAMAGVLSVFAMDFWRNTQPLAGPKEPVAR
jgi:uncharacterized protein involved in exopolysaccharide biosynthesis